MVESGIGRDDDDLSVPDEDGQLDVGGGLDDEPQQGDKGTERALSESPRSKRARLAKEKEKEKEKARYKAEPLEQKTPNAQPKTTNRNF